MKVNPKTVLATLALLGSGVALYAQIEGSDRGVAPLDSASSFQVTGIEVDVAAKNADAARLGGWKLAQRRGWQQLWSKTHGGREGGPALSDSELDAIVSGIVIEDEQIGPTRYVARLGVMFDRARASQLLGVGGTVQRSPPLLVVPVQWSGGTPVSYEDRSAWQQAWARFRAGGSPIDYVRPIGNGPEALLLTTGQMQRPGRNWWRMLLDFYGAADILSPQAHLRRLYPGGPILGTFTARYGPDNKQLSSFTLRTSGPDGLPQMLDEAVKRIDQIYGAALSDGVLRTDPSLIVAPPAPPPLPTDNAAVATTTESKPGDNGDESANSVAAETDITSTYTVQFDTPDVGSVGATEDAVKGASGVNSASTTSLALGGVSVMRVSFTGSLDKLKAALQAAGLRVEESGGTLHVRRAASAPDADTAG